MSPARGKVPYAFFLLAGGTLLSLWLLRKALAPFFIAMVLAYLMAPLVERLARVMSRGLAVALVLVGSLGALAGILGVLLPRLLAQVDRIKASWPQWKVVLETKVAPWLRAHPDVEARARQALEGVDPVDVLKRVGGASLSVLESFLGLLSLLLVPLIAYYLLMEGRALLRWADGLVPSRHRERTHRLAATVHGRMGGYVRGQLAVALVMALLQGSAFALMGVPYAWLLGAVAGLSNVVPYSPYITALPPALVLAGVEGAGPGRLALLLVVFTAVQKAEALYFTPVWVGRATHLHPLEVLLAILAFGYAFGLLGLVFAVPLMIVFKAAGEVMLEDYRKHPWFTGAA